MSLLSIIVAIDENNAIGLKNEMLCHLPNDLKYFKKVTSGHTVVMGRKTFESLPNGALPNRRNIVISRNPQLMLNNSEIIGNSEDINRILDKEETFIMGGGTIYEQYLPKADKLYITYIHHKFENADTFFPEIDLENWIETKRVFNDRDEKNPYPHSFVVYERK